MLDPVTRTALLLKSANSECNLGEYGHHESECSINPNDPSDRKFIRQAEELLSLNVDLL